jgi:GNAT superfamily N-acetyltransferase
VPDRIRVRADADLDECVRILETVHRADGYPTYWPDDPARWLSPRAMLGAWVAEDEGRIVGHIVLTAGAAEASGSVWAMTTGLSAEQFAAITRFFVSPDRRSAGVGGALLDAACAEAAAQELRPALDVVETNRDAIHFYERRGWRRVHSEPWAAAADGTLLHYYVAPG